MRPRLLDLFCGAGGCSVGYCRAGFDVVGVDINPQPNYPYEFRQADALQYLDVYGDRYDVIHASPTCQSFARVTDWRGSRDNHADLLTPTLGALAALDVPWVVENVEEAPIRADYLLCGTQFGLPVRRHRKFQCGNWAAYELIAPCGCQHLPLVPFMHKAERSFADSMGCTWMTAKEGRQAIPPAYTEYIGRQLMAFLGLDSGTETTPAPATNGPGVMELYPRGAHG